MTYRKLKHRAATSLLALLLLTVYTGCREGEGQAGPLGITDAVDEASRQTSLTVRVAVSRAADGTDEHYFENEYTVSTLELWFFHSDTGKFFKKAVVRNPRRDDTIGAGSSYDITYVFQSLRITGGVYDIFAIANYGYSPDEVDDEATFLNMVDSITCRDGIEASIPEAGPVMTSSATALLSVDLASVTGRDYVLSIDLERVFAKLQIGVAHNTFQLKHNDRKYADINITNYKLVNLNTRYYLFQHTDRLTQLTPQPQFTLSSHFADYADEDDQYVVDPFFYDKQPTATAAAAFSSHYRSWFGQFTTDDFAAMPSAPSFGYAYILENTAFKDSQKNGYSPGLVFKAAVSPVFVWLYDPAAATLQQEYRPEYWPATIYLYNFNFYGSLQAVNVAGGLTLDELETYTDAQLKPYGIKQCKFNMGVYETYYTYWIEHRRAQQPMGPMHYGIVRNNFYKMVVTGINGIGNSAITPDVMRDNYPNSYEDVVVN